ncbi:MAG: hypothetical protein WCO23_00430 [bacterium]
MKKHYILLITFILLALTCLFFLRKEIFISPKEPLKPTSENVNQNINSDSDSAKSHYEAGLTLFANQSYEAAIVEFDKAIALDNFEADYYSKKAQAESNLGQQQQAIDTINEGLKYIPTSDLLNSRLDILQRDWIGKQEQ